MDDIRPHRVEDVLQLVDDRDERLHFCGQSVGDKWRDTGGQPPLTPTGFSAQKSIHPAHRPLRQGREARAQKKNKRRRRGERGLLGYVVSAGEEEIAGNHL